MRIAGVGTVPLRKQTNDSFTKYLCVLSQLAQHTVSAMVSRERLVGVWNLQQAHSHDVGEFSLNVLSLIGKSVRSRTELFQFHKKKQICFYSLQIKEMQWLHKQSTSSRTQGRVTRTLHSLTITVYISVSQDPGCAFALFGLLIDKSRRLLSYCSINNQ